jgi:hypothetical protein
LLTVGDLIADGPDYRSYWRVLAVEPQRAIVYRSVRHLWRPHPFDPSDPAAVGRVEQELIAGGVYLDCTWTFVVQPVGAERTRLLIRTRGNYAPWLLGLVMLALGLYDASYGVAQLRAIAGRAERWPPRPQRRAWYRHPPPRVTEHWASLPTRSRLPRLANKASGRLGGPPSGRADDRASGA